MSQRSIFLGVAAVVGVLALGAPQARAGDPDVDGTDHSKLNHGVLGRVAEQSAPRQPAAAQPAGARRDDDGRRAGGDPDVDGTDHSKLNHGVLGRAAPQPTPPQAIPARPAPPIVWQSPK